MPQTYLATPKQVAKIYFICCMAGHKFVLKGEDFFLLPQRALLIPRLSALVLSDLHLGKVNHFRKAGIPVPVLANQTNTETLISLIMTHKPKRVIFIGDLFHSHYNSEWEVMGQLIKNFRECTFELIPGNHDIMSKEQYRKHSIVVHEKSLAVTTNLTLIHEPMETISDDSYYLSGHIHPAITLKGKARQSLTIPCFWFGKNQGFLPAFGAFTGYRPVKPEVGDNVFGIVKDRIIEVQLSAG